MGRFILHIGTHKTATTSIQRKLAVNRADLEKRGILYPDYDLIGQKGHYAHIGIANAFSKSHPYLTREHAIEFFRKVRERSQDYDATIISAEPFFRHVSLGPNGQPMRTPGDPDAYWMARNRYIEDLRSHFPMHDVEVVMVVRRQVDYGMSLYQEHIKTSRYTASFADFRSQYWQRFDYLRQAKSWHKYFGALHLLRFEDLISQDDIVAKFGDLISLDFHGLRPAKRENTSLIPDLIVWKRMMNASDISSERLRDQLNAFTNSSFLQKTANLPKRSLYDDFSDMKNFHLRFADANELLKRDFMSADQQESPMFSHMLSNDYTFGDILNPKFMEQLTAHLTR